MTLRQGSGQSEAWAGDVLDFWFSHSWEELWAPNDAFDAAIRERFAIEWARQARREVADFTSEAETALAAVVLFDQFPRNMFRGQADQFATDHLALEIAKEAVARGYDDGMVKERRGFLYLPFEHSEDLADQRRSLLLFTALGDDEMLKFARKHYEVIATFGRFPHRNEALGRKATAMERAAGDLRPF